MLNDFKARLDSSF